MGAGLHGLPARLLALPRLLQDRAQDRGRSARQVPDGRRGRQARRSTSHGKPRTKNVVRRTRSTPRPSSASSNFRRMFDDPQLDTAIRVTVVFVDRRRAAADGPRASCWPSSSTRQIFGRPVLRTIMILPIFATPIAVGLQLLHHLLRGGRAARLDRHPLPLQPALGAGLGHPRRRLAVDAVLLPRLPGRAPGRSGRAVRSRAHRRRLGLATSCTASCCRSSSRRSSSSCCSGWPRR